MHDQPYAVVENAAPDPPQTPNPIFPGYPTSA